MHNPYFFAGREQELRDLIDNSASRNPKQPACAGTDTNDYHPDEGQPDEVALSRCRVCPIRLDCLALALRAEDPEVRAGWYGGLGPAHRDKVAEILQLERPAPPPPDRALEAAKLRASGRTVNEISTQLGCSRRTAQRYLRLADRHNGVIGSPAGADSLAPLRTR